MLWQPDAWGRLKFSRWKHEHLVKWSFWDVLGNLVKPWHLGKVRSRSDAFEPWFWRLTENVENVLTHVKKSYDLHVIQRSSPDGTNWGTNLQTNAGTSWKTGHQISHSGHAAKVGCRGSLKEMKGRKWQGLGGCWGVNESVGYLKLGDDFFGTSNSVEWISLQLKPLKFTQPLQPRSAPNRGKTPWTDLGGHWWCRFSGQVPKPRVRIWVSGWLEEFFCGEFRVVRGKTCDFFLGWIEGGDKQFVKHRNEMELIVNHKICFAFWSFCTLKTSK